MRSFVQMPMWAGWGVVVMGIQEFGASRNTATQDEGKHAAGAAGKRDLAYLAYLVWQAGTGVCWCWAGQSALRQELATARCGWSTRFCLPVGPVAGALCGGRHLELGSLGLLVKSQTTAGELFPSDRTPPNLASRGGKNDTCVQPPAFPAVLRSSAILTQLPLFGLICDDTLSGGLVNFSQNHPEPIYCQIYFYTTFGQPVTSQYRRPAIVTKSRHDISR